MARGCTPLDTPARPAAGARAPSASTASASRARWHRLRAPPRHAGSPRTWHRRRPLSKSNPGTSA
eukprot:3962182-Prymnesium_polylepis.1